MEILALYTSPEALETALAAGARHLAGTLEGLALVYEMDSPPDQPDGWAGFTCARDASTAGSELAEFLRQLKISDQPLRTSAPRAPTRIWARAAGGLYGFPLRHNGPIRGLAIVGVPGPWPRMRKAETESILKQLTLVLDHHAVTDKVDEDPSADLLELSEQLLARDVERMQQEERMQEIEAFGKDLIERMTFELRNPLGRIVETLISVLAGEHENLSSPSRESLRQALDEGNQLMRLLQNVSDLWRLRQHQLPVAAETLNIAEVVDEAIFNVRDSLSPEVTIEKRLGSPLPNVRTDLGKLSQILFHLLENAVKFTLHGRVALAVSVEHGQLTLGVTDTGIGISADDRAHVFDEFFQVDRSPGGRFRGAGLGLTLARHLVEQLGGTIELESEVGRGTRVQVQLPVSVL
ncbi:MAG: sensor histidine kinase [Myxococcota bacterium]